MTGYHCKVLHPWRDFALFEVRFLKACSRYAALTALHQHFRCSSEHFVDVELQDLEDCFRCDRALYGPSVWALGCGSVLCYRDG